ncbi:hypothetical protein E2C01_035234 [Portunus trituberculatus]|uniref:Uncharacterized protein n=1 Tax=Portunus trituberculatus TaxID=210409 RepID=A0A5B7F980_PORTR|nr:hypothetical protein [Portunus trituberculatus]
MSVAVTNNPIKVDSVGGRSSRNSGQILLCYSRGWLPTPVCPLVALLLPGHLSGLLQAISTFNNP